MFRSLPTRLLETLDDDDDEDVVVGVVNDAMLLFEDANCNNNDNDNYNV